jgi:hypothetical protein
MLNFYPRIYPWTFYADDMTGDIPPGEFYTSAEERLPRTTKPTAFTLHTDRSDPVTIVVNGQTFGTVIPKSELTTVYLRLFDPPSVNYVTAENGVDEPSYSSVATTYMNTLMELAARESYSYAGRTTEKYYRLLTSRWASFILESQLPWRKYLPEIRSMRILAVKSIGMGLFNNPGLQEGVEDYLSAFVQSTPVFKETRNPSVWQPNVIQSVTSGEDVFGFEAHVWIPNLCLGRWLAFSKLFNNLRPYYKMQHFGEGTITLATEDSDVYQTHLFDTLGRGCSVRALLQDLGCMDSIFVTCNVDITSEVTICAYANPMDQIVEAPGIGGQHFDSGTDFDGDYGLFDNTYDVDLLTDYWIGTNLKKTFDFGKCLDVYPTTAVLPGDANCCMSGPDTVELTTLDCAESVVSTVTPNHPIFGGDAPGLLDNPYFDLLV